MLARRFIYNCFSRSLYTIYAKQFHSLQSNFTSSVNIPPKYFLKKQIPNLYTVKRFKHKTKKSGQVETADTDSDSEDDLSNQIEDHEKLLNRSVSSLRLDNVLKTCLGVGRNSIETSFYESKIRINGTKAMKKNVEEDKLKSQIHFCNLRRFDDLVHRPHQVKEDDEIDVFVDVSPDNPNFVIINRVRIVAITSMTNNYKVSFVRDKSLVIQDYR